MSEFDSLMDQLPDALRDDAPADDVGVDDDEEIEDAEGEEEIEGEDGADGGEGGESEDGEEDDDEGNPEDLGDDDDDELEVDLPDDKPAAVTPPEGAPKSAVTDEGQYILQNLPKIKTSIIVAGADGKDAVREVEVYGWGQIRNIPGFKSFATAIDQTDFVMAANKNEQKATELQTQFRQDKVKADTEAYTTRENRSIAQDLRQLRKEGLFPKFKGVPGSDAFNNSIGAKEFDRVVQFMNEQNDEAGQAAQKGNAFYHISFRQAYRMLHPEQFDTKKIQANRKAAQAAARRVKTGGGGSKPERNVTPRRVSNINDLADDFAQFVGGSN